MVTCCAISRLGKWVLSGDGDWIGTPGTLKIWDVETGECKKTLNGHTDYVRCCAVSRLGKWVFSTSANEAIVWDAATGAEVLFLSPPAAATGESFASLALGAGGLFAVGSSKGHCYLARAEGLVFGEQPQPQPQPRQLLEEQRQDEGVVVAVPRCCRVQRTGGDELLAEAAREAINAVEKAEVLIADADPACVRARRVPAASVLASVPANHFAAASSVAEAQPNRPASIGRAIGWCVKMQFDVEADSGDEDSGVIGTQTFGGRIIEVDKVANTVSCQTRSDSQIETVKFNSTRITWTRAGTRGDGWSEESSSESDSEGESYDGKSDQ